jgi:hypothetical protein
MSSRTTGKESARARAAEMRAAQQRAEKRRRALLGAGAVGVVVVIVIAFVIAKSAGVGSDDSTTTASGTGSGSSALPAAVATKLTSVPVGVLDQVGAGASSTVPKAIKAPDLLDPAAKPRILYAGAEFCPFCAAERWPVVVALSRFGTWKGLGATESASNDVFPKTPTLSFHGATYTSDLLSFTGVETTTNKPKAGGGYTALDSLTPADQTVFDTYNRAPYVDGGAGSIPFIDLGGKFVTTGASYSPDLLKGKTRAQIATALQDPNDPIAQAVDGSANLLTAAMCTLTGEQPTNVCLSTGVKAAATQLSP